MINTFFHFLRLKGLPVKQAKNSKRQYIMLDLGSAHGMDEAHISVFSDIENSSVTRRSEYHYTGTKDDQKVRIYFDEKDTVSGRSGSEHIRDYAAFESDVSVTVTEVISKLKKEWVTKLAEDLAELEKEKAVLLSLSENFPATFGKWQEQAKRIAENFAKRIAYHSVASRNQVALMGQFVTLAIAAPAQVAEPELEEVVSDAESSDVEMEGEKGVVDARGDERRAKEADLLQRYVEMVRRLNEIKVQDLNACSEDYLLLKEVQVLLDKSQCRFVSERCFERLSERIGQLSQNVLDQAIKEKKLAVVQDFAAKVELDKIGYKPRTANVLVKKEKNDPAKTAINIQLLELLVKAKVFGLSQYSLAIRETKYSIMQYAYAKKHPLLMALALRHGCSLLDPDLDGKPIFYKLFYATAHPCRQLFNTKEVSDKFDKQFFEQLAGRLASCGVEDDFIATMLDTFSGSASQNTAMLRSQAGNKAVADIVSKYMDRETIIKGDPRILPMMRQFEADCAEIYTDLPERTMKEHYIQFTRQSAGALELDEGEQTGRMLRLCQTYEYFRLYTTLMLRLLQQVGYCIRLKMWNGKELVASARNSNQKAALKVFQKAQKAFKFELAEYLNREIKKEEQERARNFKAFSDTIRSVSNMLKDHVKARDKCVEALMMKMAGEDGADRLFAEGIAAMEAGELVEQRDHLGPAPAADEPDAGDVDAILKQMK